MNLTPWWKPLLVVAVAPPLGGLAVGAIAATEARDPAPRPPLVFSSVDHHTPPPGSSTGASTAGRRDRPFSEVSVVTHVPTEIAYDDHGGSDNIAAPGDNGGSGDHRSGGDDHSGHGGGDDHGHSGNPGDPGGSGDPGDPGDSHRPGDDSGHR